jgi:hypothetical protein
MQASKSVSYGRGVQAHHSRADLVDAGGDGKWAIENIRVAERIESGCPLRPEPTTVKDSTVDHGGVAEAWTTPRPGVMHHG